MFHRAHLKWPMISTLVALIALAVSLTVGLSALATHAAAPGWKTFHDPHYGFTVRYPATWRAVTDAQGSSVSFLDPQGTTVISPLVQTSPLKPSALLARVPLGATNVRQFASPLANTPAVDFSLPYIPQTLPAGQQGGQAHERGRGMLFSTLNTAGTSNVYMLLLTQTVDSVHPVPASSVADAVFTQMEATFTSPASPMPVAIGTPATTTPTTPTVPNSFSSGTATPATPATVGASPDSATISGANAAGSNTAAWNCDMVCWANANWNFGNYWDTYRVPEGYFQPYFGCTPYVARALTQSGLMPGLREGGVYGGGGLSPDWGSMAYGNYPVRFGGSQATIRYNLNWTGTRGSTGPLPAVNGLYNYLVDSGIGTPIGENLWEARPGDVLFLDRTHTPGPSDREHAMIIAALFYDGWTGHGAYPTHGYEALLDGHNAAAYHDRMSSWTEPYFGFPSFEIVHIRGQRHDTAVAPRLSDPGAWYYQTDFGTISTLHTSTTNVWNGTTRWASYRIWTNQRCGIDLFIPAWDATEHPVQVEVKTNDGRWWRTLIYENNAGAWDFIYPENQIYRAPVEVALANADGSRTHTLGISTYVFFYC